jgi:hypothetical protein
VITPNPLGEMPTSNTIGFVILPIVLGMAGAVCHRMRIALGTALIVSVWGLSAPREAPVFAVAPTGLNNLSPNPDTRGDMAVIPVMTHEAADRLTACGYAVVGPETAPNSPGYLFEHGDVAASWGAEHHADWVLVGRLNRIGRWEADWEVQVVSVPQQRVIDTRVIELKGFGTDSALTARLANRGAAWLVDQVTQSVAHATGGSSNPRPCHA